MATAPTALIELKDHLAQVEDLHSAIELVGWDQNTMMPRHGAEARAEALATLERLSHELFVSRHTETLIQQAERDLNGSDPDSDEARLLVVSRRRFEKASRVPKELAGELAKAASLGQEAWADARAENDFQAFAPYLEQNLELARRYVECFDGFDCAYDVLLDDYDPGQKSDRVTKLFAELKAELIPLVATLADREVDTSFITREFEVNRQRALVQAVLEPMGFTTESWRLDDAVHPFACGVSPRDIRITTRWDPSYFPGALYGAMHECGHGLYEAGIPAELARTPVGRADSLSLHESQSRMWENMVGRSRPFSGVLAGMIAEHLGAEVDPDQLFRAVNRVERSFIRVEADEATYGLHIILRFELEQELIEGRLAIADLPEAWNSRFYELFGVEVPDDAQGVLQDVHWSAGLIGYFPTYSIGNLVAGQLWVSINEDLPELDGQLASANLAPLREWLREHVHRHGAKFPTEELLGREIGNGIEVQPFVSYLKAKLSDAYATEL